MSKKEGAFWVAHRYGSGSTFYVGTTSLGSIDYQKGGYVGRGIFGRWKSPIADVEQAKQLVVESVRALLQSQLRAVNKMLGREERP